MRRPSARRGTLATAALLLVPALAACGADPDTDSGAATGSGDGSASAEAFPVTVAHKYGETTVEEEPQRVVTVGLVEQDALLALDVVPVAATKWFGEAPGAIFPWATDRLGDAELPTVLDGTNGIRVEKVASLEPDLIVGLYSGMTEQEYTLLSKIAPTVAQPEEYVDFGVPWDEATLTVGKVVGKPDEAQELVEEVTGRIEQAAQEHPEFEGKTAAVVTPYEGVWVYGPQDPRGRLLDQLGFTFPAELREEETDDFGWSISAERTDDLGALDTVVWLDLGNADAGMTRLWEGTAAAEEGRFLDISDDSGSYYVAHSMVTPLSIPYVLDRYVPQLAAAVDGDPATEPPAVTD